MRKAWRLASIAVARRRFSSRLTDILRRLDSNAVMVALDVNEDEVELCSACSQDAGEHKNWQSFKH